jgi:hypothetical protein
MSKETDLDRRRIFGTAAMALAAAQFGLIGSADAQSRISSPSLTLSNRRRWSAECHETTLTKCGANMSPPRYCRHGGIHGASLTSLRVGVRCDLQRQRAALPQQGKRLSAA